VATASCGIASSEPNALINEPSPTVAAAPAIVGASLDPNSLLECAVGDEAGHSGVFLWHLGKLDRGARWREPLEARVPQMRIGGALTTYVTGWAEGDASGANTSH
jgi:hypothetical protein